jgi:hypothetical protein
MTLEIRKVLVLSTSHVSEETADWLDGAFDPFNLNLGVSPVSGGHYDSAGWFVYVPTEMNPKFPDDLEAVIQFARDNGVQHLLFDRDADRIEGLPVYEW